jgi:lysine 2,3-aminomutase
VSRILTTPSALAQAGLVRPEDIAVLDCVAERYAISITPQIASLIEHADDPIGRQFLPTASELRDRDDEAADPIGDAAHSPVQGIVHRYRDRVLLKLVQACPVYCRFCFRRAEVGPGEGALSAAELDAALAYIRAHPEIWELIVTGGDPFILSARRAAALVAQVSAIGHVRILRWHTRVPVVDPQRISDDFVRSITLAGGATYVVLHANHPRELTQEARRACAKIVDAGIPMLSQSVLLKGINDDIDTLEALMRAFVEARIKPYYLHHLDRAPGTSHFRVPIAQGRELIRQLRARASGLCQPEYVLDGPEERAKQRLLEVGNQALS